MSTEESMGLTLEEKSAREAAMYGDPANRGPVNLGIQPGKIPKPFSSTNTDVVQVFEVIRGMVTAKFVA